MALTSGFFTSTLGTVTSMRVLTSAEVSGERVPSEEGRGKSLKGSQTSKEKGSKMLLPRLPKKLGIIAISVSLLHGMRVCLAFMSFNGGVFLVAIAGHMLGFLLFGSRDLGTLSSGKTFHLPPMSC
ncbi:hypothetical protein GQ457_07G034980 [Hibiscus cannabinus]